MVSKSKGSERPGGLQPDGSFVIDDSTIEPPTAEELEAVRRKKQKHQEWLKKPEPPPA